MRQEPNCIAINFRIFGDCVVWVKIKKWMRILVRLKFRLGIRKLMRRLNEIKTQVDD